MIDRIEELKADMTSNGIYTSARIQLRSDRFERLPADGRHKGNQDIFLRYDPVHDSVIYGDWGQGGSHYVYRFKEDRDYPQSAFDLLPHIMKDNENQSEQDDRFMTGYAKAIYQNHPAASPLHPYLQRKKVKPHMVKQSADGRLIVPVYDDRCEITGIQFISADGSKRFLKGSKMNGGHLVLGKKESEYIFIVEGFATGASVEEQTGMATYISFSAGNLMAVASLVRERYPAKAIVIIADNDVSGTGQKAAKEAAEATGISYVITPIEGYDANDYVNTGGNIMALINKEKI